MNPPRDQETLIRESRMTLMIYNPNTFDCDC